MIVAIDGPAGSGKSTTACGIARRLGFYLLESGAMYRAVALACIRRGVDPVAANIGYVLDDTKMVIECTKRELGVVLDGEDVSDALRAPDVSRAASVVAAFPTVRDRMVARQRVLGERYRDNPGLVVEGRDIGTVVYPDADIKFYLTAPADVRARRRQAELMDAEGFAAFRRVLREIQARDQRDKSRDHSPLKRADDAFEINTADRTITEQLDYIERLIRERIGM